MLAALLLAVCWLAFSPAPPPSADTGWDKANHALAFAALSLVAFFGTTRQRGRALRVGLGLLAFGVAIEVVQSRIPARSGDVEDVLANAVGIGIGLAVAALLARRSRNP